MGIGLSIDLPQFDTDQGEGTKDMGIEKIGSLIERFKELAVLLFQNGLQLIDISHEEHLLASKRLAHLMTVDAQDLVDEVDNIGSHH